MTHPTSPDPKIDKQFMQGEKVGFGAVLASEYRIGTFIKYLNYPLAEVYYDDHKEVNHISNLFKIEEQL